MDEFVSLTVAYFKQETVDPIKALGRFIAFGIAGGLLLAVGGGLLALAAIRCHTGRGWAASERQPDFHSLFRRGRRRRGRRRLGRCSASPGPPVAD